MYPQTVRKRIAIGAGDLPLGARSDKANYSPDNCPVLIMSGDRNAYHTIDRVTQAAKLIPKSQLRINPGRRLVVLFCNFPAVWELIPPFI